MKATDLKEWLAGDLEDEAIVFGPLTASRRYRITSGSSRFAALTDGGRLAAVVDRDELARKVALAELEPSIRLTSPRLQTAAAI